MLAFVLAAALYYHVSLHPFPDGENSVESDGVKQ